MLPQAAYAMLACARIGAVHKCVSIPRALYALQSFCHCPTPLLMFSLIPVFRMSRSRPHVLLANSHRSVVFDGFSLQALRDRIDSASVEVGR